MTEVARITALELIFGDGEERERPDLARLMDLRRRGACADMDPALFFPARGQSAAPAKAACRDCPARAACLSYAIEHREWWGVWGGTAEKDRRPLNLLEAEGVPVEDIVAQALAGDLDDEMAARRRSPRIPTSARQNLPYGWTVRGEEVVPDAGEQEIIARLRALCANGDTPHEAAGRLNAEGLRTRRGAEWTGAMVARALRRPSPHAGDLEQVAS